MTSTVRTIARIGFHSGILIPSSFSSLRRSARFPHNVEEFRKARSLEEDLDDDGEKESRAHHAARAAAACPKPLLPDLTDEVAAIDRALYGLGLTRHDGALRVPRARIRLSAAMIDRKSVV